MLKSIRRKSILLGLSLVVIFTSGVLAEETPVLQVGAKIRATVPKEYSAYTLPPSGNETTNVWLDDFDTKPLETEQFTKLTGTLLFFDETTITLIVSPHEPSVQILRQDISKLELFKGTRSGGAGGVLGLGVGAALGYVMGIALGDDPPPDAFMEMSMSAENKAAAGAVIFGAIGALVGSRVYGGDVWETVQTHNLQLGFSKGSHGETGLILSARF